MLLAKWKGQSDKCQVTEWKNEIHEWLTYLLFYEELDAHWLHILATELIEVLHHAVRNLCGSM